MLRTADGDYKLVDFGAVGLLQPEIESTQAGEIAGPRTAGEVLDALSRLDRLVPQAPVAIAAVVVAGLVLVWLLVPAPSGGFWLRLLIGVVVVAVALFTAYRVRRLVGPAPEAERHATGILTGAASRSARFTLVMLIREAEEAKDSSDRVAALTQMVTLMEKLTRQLLPWYVRHKEAIATSIAIVGSLAGVVSVVSGFLR